MVKPQTDTTSGDAVQPTAEEIRSALERVLRSRCFEHAGRASEFLRFVVEQTLAGDGDRLKGYTIAIEVFGRPPTFDAQSDPLVRVEALRLRQRLTEYYAGEGSADPVRLSLPRGSYAVKAEYAAARAAPAAAAPPQRPSLLATLAGTRRRLAAAAGAVMLAAGLAVAVLYSWAPAPALAPPPPAPLDRSERTRIAVVPLENLGGTADLDRLAASLTEEIMVRLADLDLYVIALQPRSEHHGKSFDGLAANRHGYVLTGTVREQAGGARITLRIIEAGSGALIWSKAFDEPLGLAEQPERQARIARDAAAAAGLFGPVFDAELALARRSSHALDLPDCEARYQAFRRAADPALFPDALACFQSLVTRHPELPAAWAGLAMLAIDEHVYYSGTTDGGASFVRARAAVDMAIELDETNVMANVARARFQYYAGDPNFVRTAERTIALDPKNPELLGLMAILLTAHGETQRGLELVARSQALSAQLRPVFNMARVYAFLQTGEPCAALDEAERMGVDKWFIAHMATTAAASLCGDKAAAARARAHLLAAVPSFEADGIRLIDIWQFEPRLRHAVLTGLRAAGLKLNDEPLRTPDR